jgi:site-specific recombinase XerC
MAAQGALYQWNLPLAQMLGIPLIKGIATLSPETFQATILIERAGPLTRKKFFEFFTVPIRNAKTRAAYYRAIQQFLAWAERAGYQHLEDIEPITVAAYIETLQRHAAPATVKQHMAAIRMMFSWLTEKGVLAMNRAREVKTERFSRTEGKTPAFVEGEVQKLLNVIETATHTGLRDRALLGTLAYTFARIGAVVNLKVEDYYPSGKRFSLRFKEKGGKERIFWKMTAPLKPLRESLATQIAEPRNSMIAVVRRFSSKTWRGFGISGHSPDDLPHRKIANRKLSHAIPLGLDAPWEGCLALVINSCSYR